MSNWDDLSWDEVEDKPREGNDTSIQPKPLAGQESRTNLKSFWVGCCGLAILGHVLTFLMAVANRPIRDWMLNLGTAYGRDYGLSDIWSLSQILSGSPVLFLYPAFTVTAITAPLHWRGRVSWRALLASCMVMTTLGVLLFPSRNMNWVSGQLIRDIFPFVAGLVACWFAFPCIYLLPPFDRIRWLRRASGTLLVAIMFCLVLVAIREFPAAFPLLVWAAFLGPTLGFSILLRNWGGIVLYEREGERYGTDETSSGTLIEMMSIGGILTAIVLPITNNYFWFSPVVLVCAAVLGPVTLLASLLVIRSRLTGGSTSSLLFMLLLFLLGGFLTGLQSDIFLSSLYGRDLEFDLTNPDVWVTMGIGYLVVVLHFLFAFLAATWLKNFGWSWGKSLSFEKKTA